MSAGDRSLTLQFLGTGGAFTRRFGTTCSMLTLANGKRWLIDCGRQAPDQLDKVGLAWHEIEGQILTHVHGDHVFGLEDFAFRRYFETLGEVHSVMTGGPRPKLIVHHAVEDELWECMGPSLRYLKGPKGEPTGGKLAHYFERLEASRVEAPRGNPWAHAETFVAEKLAVTARESEHVQGKPSCSLEIRQSADAEAQAWWSGDCTVDGDYLCALAPKTSIFFHDCTFVDYPGQVHGAFRLLAKLPEEVRRKIVLMHYEDDIEDHRSEVESLGFRIAMPGDVYDLERGLRIEG